MTYLAVFDWNGTLFDDITANHIGGNAALKALGKDPISLETYRDTFDFPIIHFYKRNGINVDDYLEDISKANGAFFPIYEELAAKCPARDHAKEILAWCNEQNITTLILSNHIKESIEQNLKRLDLLDHIDHISSNPHDNDIVLKMNKQERLEKFMADHGFEPEKAFIIGDSLEEPEIGKNTGMISISITGGCISEKRLKKADPDYLIRKLPELKEILVKHWSVLV